ncbi:hypothetical protein DY000_02053309 [Brassica cretica]|uniref:Uncharacterized protein n=1 Tax=Brassica cretica TaxID=69181 RepID=A0ABQ7A4W5_BRACR|nr:hypothetical protein DY000_02053309 [Brassica cretica]
MFEGTKADLQHNRAQLCLSWGLVYMGSDSSNKSGRETLDIRGRAHHMVDFSVDVLHRDLELDDLPAYYLLKFFLWKRCFLIFALPLTSPVGGVMALVYAQQDQKQQGNSIAILIRSCKFGTFDLQRKTLLIDRQQHQFVTRFSSTTVDPDTSLVDRHSLTTVDRGHSSVDLYLPSDVDRYFSPNIDRYLTERHGCDFDSCT